MQYGSSISETTIQLDCVHCHVAAISPGQMRQVEAVLKFDDVALLAFLDAHSVPLRFVNAKEKIIRECIGYRMHTRSQCARHNFKDIRYFRMCSARHPSVVIVGSSESGEVMMRNAGKLVVVIDDDPPVLETTASLLRSSGFQVVAAESYSEAMDRLSKLGRRADLIVCGAITDSC